MDLAARRQVIRAWLDSRPTNPPARPIRRGSELRVVEARDLDSADSHRRRLPHWELATATYFVTFRVRLARRRPFALRSPIRGNEFPAERIPVAARLVEEAILFAHGLRYEIDSYVVMPDHVHMLITPRPGSSLARVLHSVKSVSALEVNRATGCSGPLWQDESLDHLIRSGADWIDKREYIHQNPVAAGLVKRAGDYPPSSATTLDPPGRRGARRRALERGT